MRVCVFVCCVCAMRVFVCCVCACAYFHVCKCKCGVYTVVSCCLRHACHKWPSSVLPPPVQLNNSVCSFLKPASRELARVVMATVNFNAAGVAGSIVMVSHLGPVYMT